ncbi:MAG: hypothetical protein WC551_09525 [Patescibacteria group bacterium]
MAYDAAVSASATLYDHVTYRTNQPVGSVLSWSATVDGAIIPIRIAGTEEYGASAVSVYSSSGGFWGAAPLLELQLTEEHEGKIVVLLVSSVVSGVAISDTTNISVGVLTIEVDIEWATVEVTAYAVAASTDFDSGYDGTVSSVLLDGMRYNHALSWNATVECDFEESSLHAEYTGFPAGTLSISLLTGIEGGGSLAAMYTITSKIGEFVIDSAECILGVAGDETAAKTPWLTVDCETGEITVIDP